MGEGGDEGFFLEVGEVFVDGGFIGVEACEGDTLEDGMDGEGGRVGGLELD